jgi:hypothetical protein
MILRRLTSSLKQQHWTTIFIELLIVIIGVFIGTQVSNWNEARIQKAQTQRMLNQLRPELSNQLTFFRTARDYYSTTRNFAGQAVRGWEGNPSVSNGQFVIAAYQASQIYGIGINPQTWALTFGADQLRDIDDPLLRRSLVGVLTADYEPVGFNAVATRYREHVRQLIPSAIQDDIGAECGDRNIQRDGGQYLVALPKTCALQLDPVVAAKAAATLRSHPELVTELNWHLAAIATYIANADGLEGGMLMLQRRLDRRP